MTNLQLKRAWNVSPSIDLQTISLESGEPLVVNYDNGETSLIIGGKVGVDHTVLSTSEIRSKLEKSDIIAGDNVTITSGSNNTLTISVADTPDVVINWGDIEGTLSDQTDLQNALDAKANQTDLTNLTTRVATNETNIGVNTTNISTNTSDIEDIKDALANQEHFRGYYATTVEIQALTNPKNGDFAYNAEDGKEWVYSTSWNATTRNIPDQTVPKTALTPLMNGTATIGSDNAYAAGNHIHPTDTTRASQTDFLDFQTTTNTLLDTKVDKIVGKGLSTEDYTTTEKTKLSGIADGAEVNVQSDWNETDDTSDAFIINKPELPTIVQSTGTSTTDVMSQNAVTTAINTSRPTLDSVLNQGNTSSEDIILNNNSNSISLSGLDNDSGEPTITITDTMSVSKLTQKSLNISVPSYGSAILNTDSTISLNLNNEVSGCNISLDTLINPQIILTKDSELSKTNVNHNGVLVESNDSTYETLISSYSIMLHNNSTSNVGGISSDGIGFGIPDVEKSQFNRTGVLFSKNVISGNYQTNFENIVEETAYRIEGVKLYDFKFHYVDNGDGTYTPMIESDDEVKQVWKDYLNVSSDFGEVVL